MCCASLADLRAHLASRAQVSEFPGTHKKLTQGSFTYTPEMNGLGDFDVLGEHLTRRLNEPLLQTLAAAVRQRRAGR